MTDYKPQQLDKKWQTRWTAANAFEVEADPSRNCSVRNSLCSWVEYKRYL